MAVATATGEPEAIVIRRSKKQNKPWVFPGGFRFNPRDFELINDYLKAKIERRPLPCNLINEITLQDHSPEELVEKYKVWGENKWYFFTPRDRKYPNGQRPNRRAGDGYWKATGTDNKIVRDGEVIGLKRALVFYRGKSREGDKTEWIMTEYRIADAPENNTRKPNGSMQLDRWVLCSIQKKRGADKENQEAIPKPKQTTAPDANKRKQQADRSRASNRKARRISNQSNRLLAPIDQHLSIVPQMNKHACEIGQCSSIQVPMNQNEALAMKMLNNPDPEIRVKNSQPIVENASLLSDMKVEQIPSPSFQSNKMPVPINQNGLMDPLASSFDELSADIEAIIGRHQCPDFSSLIGKQISDPGSSEVLKSSTNGWASF